MRSLRSRWGTECVPVYNGYKAILRHARSGIPTLSYVVGDQRPRKKHVTHTVQFLNRDTEFLTGADKMAKRSGQVVIYPAFSRPRRGYYNLEFKIIEDNPGEVSDFRIIEKYVHLLETSIHKNPALWLWSHKRWKGNGELRMEN